MESVFIIFRNLLPSFFEMEYVCILFSKYNLFSSFSKSDHFPPKIEFCLKIPLRDKAIHFFSYPRHLMAPVHSTLGSQPLGPNLNPNTLLLAPFLCPPAPRLVPCTHPLPPSTFFYATIFSLEQGWITVFRLGGVSLMPRTWILDQFFLDSGIPDSESGTRFLVLGFWVLISSHLSPHLNRSLQNITTISNAKKGIWVRFKCILSFKYQNAFWMDFVDQDTCWFNQRVGIFRECILDVICFLFLSLIIFKHRHFWYFLC